MIGNNTDSGGRRYSLIDAMVYVTLLAVPLAVLKRACLVEGPTPGGLGFLSGLATVGAICLLGALIGIGMTVISRGRSYFWIGGLFGFLLTLLLLVILALFLYITTPPQRPIGPIRQRASAPSHRQQEELGKENQ